ncbi:hypothetical protein JHK84_043748 [Glycine max]|nr:hypothetical protein JHK85_044228 [Glycine max]KAG5117635.1 hypothetical protein JHK84_043748 [Glycine max]
MLPTLNAAGDVLLTDPLSPRLGNIGHGDLVLLRSPLNPKIRLMKRVEGDNVTYFDALHSKAAQVAVVPKRHVWIQGDNIYASRDSRHFGPVPYGLIEGKVFFRTIYPELIRTFWRNVEFANRKVIVFKVLGTKVNADKAGDQKTIVYNLMCDKAKIWANILNKSVLHKVGSKKSVLNLHKFVLFHLMGNLPFDMPHTIYINILRGLKGLGGLDDIYYATLIKKVLCDQGIYHVFDKMDDNFKHTIIAKGSVIAKQQKYSKTNLKAMKVALKQNLKKALQVDLDAIDKRKQKSLAKAITDEDRGLNSFGIAKKI